MNPLERIADRSHELGEEALAALAAYDHLQRRGASIDAMTAALSAYNVAIANIAELSKLPFDRVDFELKRIAARRRERFLRIAARVYHG